MSATWGPPLFVLGQACADDDHGLCRGHWERQRDGHAVECECGCHEEAGCEVCTECGGTGNAKIGVRGNNADIDCAHCHGQGVREADQ